MDGTRFGEGDLKSDLVHRASQFLAARGFSVRLPREGSLANELSAGSDQLLRADNSQEDLEKLKALGREAGVEAVFAQSFRIKVGPGGFYNPIWGDMTSAMNSAHLRAALLETNTGKVAWQNSVYLRRIPRVDEGVYQKAIASLYQEPKPGKRN